MDFGWVDFRLFMLPCQWLNKIFYYIFLATLLTMFNDFETMLKNNL